MKYKFETDQKTQPEVSMFHFWVSLAIGVLAFVAACLLPIGAKAQKRDSVSLITTNYTRTPQINVVPFTVYPRFEQKTDTITVRVVCETDASTDIFGSTPMVAVNKVQERTLVNRGFTQPRGHAPVFDWVVKFVRYLEPIEGCYHLVPLTQTNNQ
jgi:hypothetical protein